MTFKLSQKVSLEKGDRIRVSEGPYYLSNSGARIKLGEKGTGVFTGSSSDGTSISVTFDRDQTSKYVYIGPEKVSPTTGTIMRPHKITKIRKKKNAS